MPSAIDLTSQLKKHMKEGNLVLGGKNTMKAVREGKVKTVFLANNCPRELIADLDHYKTLSNLEIKKLPVHSDETGAILKKKYPISVAGLLNAK